MKKRVNLENVTILDLLYILTKKYSRKPALQIKEKDRIRTITYDELRERSVAVSSFIIEKGIRERTPIAILSENRPEWAIAFFGIISSACITVPIDSKLSPKEIIFILNDCGAECIFTSGKFLNLIIENKKDKLPNIKYIISFDPSDKAGVIYIEDLKWQEGKPRNRPQAVKPEETVLIVYTSGTTGVAKGVELSYRNLLFEVMSLYEVIQFNTQDSFISILPLNHMLEITGDLIAPLYGGATVTYCPTLKPHYIISLMKEVKATGMICVPLILKMFYNGIMKEVESLNWFKQKIFKFLMKLSRFLLRFKIYAGKYLFASLHKKFGKNFKYFVCGGAPLDPELEKNFDALGFTILQGYGLTETSPVVTVNTPKERKYGSVGKPLKGVEVKILKTGEKEKEGEIIVKGPNVMKGYYKNPQKTSEVIKDGWFYTGDIGYFDEDGFLYISGRAKNLIVLGAGKKVFPEEVEQVIGESPYIKEICVLGRKATVGIRKGTEEVFAVIVPNLDNFSQEERKNQKKIKEKISQEINRLSQNLADYKRISDFFLYFGELPKTSTRKIKRKEVINLIENLEREKALEKKGEFLEGIKFEEDEISISLKKIISEETGVSLENIHPNSYLSSDLGVDSLQRVEIICKIEKELGITLSESIIYEIFTFADLVRFVKEYQEGRKDIPVDWEKEVKSILRRKKIFYLSRISAVLFLKLFSKLYFRLKVKGAKDLPQSNSFIIAANHSSHLDFPLLFSTLPLSKTHNVLAPAAADYFYKNKIRRLFLEICFNTFPFERYGNFIQGLKFCEELLKRGNSLIIFPEGTRSRSGEVGEFKPGIGALSCRLGVPIIPVYIKDAYKALPKGKTFPKPYKIEIKIGRILYPPSSKGDYHLYKNIAQKVKSEIIKLKEKE